MAQSITNSNSNNRRSSIFSRNGLVGNGKPQTASQFSPFSVKNMNLQNTRGLDTSKMYAPTLFPKENTPVTPKTTPAPQSPAPVVQQGMYTPQTQTQTTTAMTMPTKQSDSIQTKGLLTPPTKTTSFGSLVEDLATTSRKDKQQQDLIREIQRAAQENKAIGENARKTAEMYAGEIQRVGNLGAGANAGYLSSGSNVVGAGNAAIASQSVSARMQALAQAQQAALEGTSQQFTGQQQTANALNQALSGAATQQQLGISGLGTAAGLAAPSPAGYGQTTFNPLTGGFSGGQTGLDPQATANQLAQQVRSGQMTYDQAVSSLGYAGGAGQQFLNQALQSGGGFNIPLSQATIAGQTGVIQQLPQLQAAEVAAEGIKNKIDVYLNANPQINPVDIAAGNKLKQWVEGKQLTDPKYQTFFNYLNEYTSTLAPILGVGGDPTNLKTEIAQSFVNAAASGESIQKVLADLQLLSRGKLQDFQSGAMGGGAISNPNIAGGTGSGGQFDW